MLRIEKIDSYDLEVLRKAAFWKWLPDFKNKSVFIKPNLVMPPTIREQATTTHVNIVKVVIEKLKDLGAINIVVGDCGFKGQWKKTITLSGYDSLEKEYGICLIGLQEQPNLHYFTMIRAKGYSFNTLITDKGYMSLFGFKFSNFALGADCIVNLPKLKKHKMVGITGSIKNLMGIMSEKGSMHPNANEEILHKRLVDLYLTLKDKVIFSLVDGIVASDYAETLGVPVRKNVLIYGDDMFEVDKACAEQWGLDPMNINYLKYINQLSK
jgi:uncharacterized protein (DUF362 family)